MVVTSYSNLMLVSRYSVNVRGLDRSVCRSAYRTFLATAGSYFFLRRTEVRRLRSCGHRPPNTLNRAAFETEKSPSLRTGGDSALNSPAVTFANGAVSHSRGPPPRTTPLPTLALSRNRYNPTLTSLLSS